MTNVIIHGILAKKFGKSIKLRVGNIKSIVSAIDSMKRGFRKELCELFNEKVYYNIIISKSEQNEIHFIPCLLGFGSSFYKIFGWILMVVAIAIQVIPVVGQIFGSWAATVAWSLITLSALSGAYGAKLDAMAKIQAMYAQLAEQMKNASKDRSTGGGTKLIGGAGASYLFSNEVNFNSQGQIVRIGYGKMKAGTNTIGVSIKNTPTNISLEDYASSISNNIMPLYD